MSLTSTQFSNLNLDGVIDAFKTILLAKGFTLVTDTTTWTTFVGSMKVRCFKRGNVYLHMASPAVGSPYGNMGRNNGVDGNAINFWLAKQDETATPRHHNFYRDGSNAQWHWAEDVTAFSSITILHNNDNIHVIAKDPKNKYHHFGCGFFAKHFTFNDGFYVYAGSNYGRLPFNYNNGLYVLTDIYTGSIKYRCGGYPNINQAYEYNSSLLSHSPNSFNGVPVLAPILIGVEHQGNLSYHGHVDTVRAIRMPYIEEEAIIQIGNDKWQCFPCITKNKAQAQGLAFKVL